MKNEKGFWFQEKQLGGGGGNLKIWHLEDTLRDFQSLLFLDQVMGPFPVHLFFCSHWPVYIVHILIDHIAYLYYDACYSYQDCPQPGLCQPLAGSLSSTHSQGTGRQDLSPFLPRFPFFPASPFDMDVKVKRSLGNKLTSFHARPMSPLSPFIPGMPFLSHIIMSIWILKVAGALTHDCSWSSIFLEGKVLTYSCQLPYQDNCESES